MAGGDSLFPAEKTVAICVVLLKPLLGLISCVVLGDVNIIRVSIPAATAAASTIVVIFLPALLLFVLVVVSNIILVSGRHVSSASAAIVNASLPPPPLGLSVELFKH
jgi:hypothetical protein